MAINHLIQFVLMIFDGSMPNQFFTWGKQVINSHFGHKMAKFLLEPVVNGNEPFNTVGFNDI